MDDLKVELLIVSERKKARWEGKLLYEFEVDEDRPWLGGVEDEDEAKIGGLCGEIVRG